MRKQGSFACHPERQRRILAVSKEERFFVASLLRMTWGRALQCFEGLGVLLSSVTRYNQSRERQQNNDFVAAVALYSRLRERNKIKILLRLEWRCDIMMLSGVKLIVRLRRIPIHIRGHSGFIMRILDKRVYRFIRSCINLSFYIRQFAVLAALRFQYSIISHHRIIR